MFLGLRRVRFNFGAVLEQYQYLVRQEEIARDERQVNTIVQLDRVNDELMKTHQQWLQYSKFLDDFIKRNYRAQESQVQQPSAKQSSFFSSLFGGSQSVSLKDTRLQSTQQDHNRPFVQQIQGLYVFGSPGCGKTYIMDLFYEQCQIAQKKRIHFNEFMLDIQKDLHKCSSKEDPVNKVGTAKAKELRLLCLDEFQVTDIGDALILKRLFETMINNHMVLVATSNRPPEDLYKGGLQRHLFLPFIPFLKQSCIIHNMDSQVDYRYSYSEAQSERLLTYISPLDESAEQTIKGVFKRISGTDKFYEKEIEVIEGRNFKVKKQANGVALFEYEELCEDVVGASDFIALCRNYHTICLKGVKQISMSNRNAARRFILLIDEMYNHKTKLYCSAERDLMNLFIVKNKGDQYDEEFALERCRSRLKEMQSKEYLETPSYYDQQKQ
ncbi:unnamed protein product [Paramecium sonneborni]|uniref:AFG1-like ATPase n=1 Tax=Paramecium sonneborni TaxID=65129 RepID=A0A8S1QSA4_9CILI|nr:unnamed protein product [Paramecium sonneborni]